MNKIKDISDIYEWHNTELNHSCGLYKVVLLESGKAYYFIKNAGSVGAICHYLDRPADECVSIIRNDVKQEFLDWLDNRTLKGETK